MHGTCYPQNLCLALVLLLAPGLAAAAWKASQEQQAAHEPTVLAPFANPGLCMRRGGFPVLKLLLALGLAAAAAKVYQDKQAADGGQEPAPVELPFKGKRR